MTQLGCVRRPPRLLHADLTGFGQLDKRAGDGTRNVTAGRKAAAVLHVG